MKLPQDPRVQAILIIAVALAICSVIWMLPMYQCIYFSGVADPRWTVECLHGHYQ